MVEGMMAFGKLETGARILDFECCEDVVAEDFRGTFNVQGMRDGNVYMKVGRNFLSFFHRNTRRTFAPGKHFPNVH